MASSAAPEALTDLPNVGPAVARTLVRLGIAAPGDLRGQDPDELFARLCALDGRPHDPCLLDTFTAVVDHAGGAPARPWWEYSRERKARAQAAKTSAMPSGSSTASAAPSRVDVTPAS
jgi:Pathogenicity locus